MLRLPTAVPLAEQAVLLSASAFFSLFCTLPATAMRSSDDNVGPVLTQFF